MALSMRIGGVTILVGVLAHLSAVAAAETGTIVGKVVYTGEKSAPKLIEITKDTEKCGVEKAAEELVVGPGQGLQWAVVSLAGAEGEAPRQTPEVKLDQSECQFTPHVVVVSPGADLTVMNSDGILHNVHTYSEKNRPVNKAQPGFLKEIRLRFDEAEVVKVACNVHSWMNAWIIVSDSPHVAVTDEEGSFKLTGVKPGTYGLKLWHEVLGERSREVTVKAGEETKVTFELDLK